MYGGGEFCSSEHDAAAINMGFTNRNRTMGKKELVINISPIRSGKHHYNFSQLLLRPFRVCRRESAGFETY